MEHSVYIIIVTLGGVMEIIVMKFVLLKISNYSCPMIVLICQLTFGG